MKITTKLQLQMAAASKILCKIGQRQRALITKLFVSRIWGKTLLQLPQIILSAIKYKQTYGLYSRLVQATVATRAGHSKS